LNSEIEGELISRLRELHGKMPLEVIRKKLGVSKPLLLYLLGKAGLPLKRTRIQTITVVRWKPTKEGGSAPTLRVSRHIVRKLGLKDGDKVQWVIEKGRIVGLPLTLRKAGEP